MRTYFLQKKTKNYTASGTSPTTYVQALAGDMAKFTSKLMDKSVKAQVNSGKLTKAQSTELLNAYKSSSKLYAEEQSTFNTKFISQLLLDEADGPVTKTSLDTADMIYRSVIGTGDKPGRVREFFRLIDKATKKIGPEGKSILTQKGADVIRQKMQGQFFNDILKTVTNDGIINPKAVIEFTSGRKGPGERVLKELFKGNGSTLKNMEKYLNAMVLAQSKGIEKQKGSLAFISGQFGAAGTMLALGRGSAVAVGTALGILGGPKIISKLFSDPKFVDNLLKIQTTPSGTSAYGRSFVQVLNNLIANQAVDPILAKRFVDEAVIEDIFPDPEEAKSQMKWYEKVEDSDLTSEENDNPALLDLQAKFNQSPPGLLEQLGIKTLDSEPTTDTAMNLAPPSMSALNLSSLGESSAPPSQSINPNTLASLDAVGMPLFQAKDGGLASLKNFKKPQVVS